MDPLSNVLSSIRVERALFVRASLGDERRVDAGALLSDAADARSRAQVVAVLHVVVEGSVLFERAGSEAIRGDAGDVVAIPRGDVHRIAPASDLRRTVVVSAALALDRDLGREVLAQLPAIFGLPASRGQIGSWIEPAMRGIVGDGDPRSTGTSLVTAKLGELLLLETLRAYAASSPALEPVWSVAARDPVIARCLTLLHGDPARPWSLDDLARRVHVSRSVLAARFTEVVGVPPVQYLTRFRLTIAARLLRDGHASLASIAERVGYRSEAAFHRAFKRTFGVCPGSYRRERGVARRAEHAADAA